MIEHRDTVLKLVSGEYWGGNTNIVCPYCDGHYTHIRNVGTLVGDDPSEATPAYKGTQAVGQTENYRRSALEIVFQCEDCPKPFSLVVQQHKGINHLMIRTDAPKLPRVEHG